MGSAPHTMNYLRHLKSQLVTQQVLPQWFVENEATRVTDLWLNSLEGKAATRHAAWASMNRTLPIDLAMEPSPESLANAVASLRNDRLQKLLADDSPFSEIMTHKLLGEYMRETLRGHREWKRMASKLSSGAAGPEPKFGRTFADWLQRRSDQTKRNQETVLKWQRNKNTRASRDVVLKRRIAPVSGVVLALQELEQLAYEDVAGTRRLARQGVAMADRIREIERIGRARLEGKSDGIGAWITYREFLDVLEPALFSLKAFAPTTVRATELLSPDNDLFVETDAASKNHAPSIATQAGSKIAARKADCETEFSKWAAKKDAARKKQRRARLRAQREIKKERAAKKQQSDEAMKKWQRGIKRGKYYSSAKGSFARRREPKFRPKKAWVDVARQERDTQVADDLTPEDMIFDDEEDEYDLF